MSRHFKFLQMEMLVESTIWGFREEQVPLIFLNQGLLQFKNIVVNMDKFIIIRFLYAHTLIQYSIKHSLEVTSGMVNL